jgi:hypothetical protein
MRETLQVDSAQFQLYKAFEFQKINKEFKLDTSIIKLIMNNSMVVESVQKATSQISSNFLK